METVQAATFEQFQIWAPTFEHSTFQAGDGSIDVYGVNGSNIEVWLTNSRGVLLDLRGNSTGQGVDRAPVVNLKQPFNVGDELVIVDTTLNLKSSNFEVPSVLPSSFVPYCFGDSGGTLCPCLNHGAPGEGCLNSGGSGTTLGASGTPVVEVDTLVLNATGAPNGVPGLFFSGSLQPGAGNGVPFGDGLLCAGGSIVRLQVVITNGSGDASSSIGISTKDGSTPGTTRFYQYWFRDVGGPCGNDFNTSGALAVTWM